MEDLAYEINVAAAKLARAAADKLDEKTPDRPRFVAGALGPTNRTASISPDVNDPGFRNVTFDELREAYKEQARGLIDGGADIMLIETIFDTLNAKAAGVRHARGVRRDGHRAADDDLGHHHRPLGPHAVGPDAGGVLVLDAPPEAILDRAQLRARRRADAALYRRARGRRRRARLAYPNAGLPNAMGEYDESPHDMACQIEPWAKDGLVNIVGGCCGSTPEHIAHIGEHVEISAAQVPKLGAACGSPASSLSCTGRVWSISWRVS